jgi:methylase of polypeptide subunit release factors
LNGSVSRDPLIARLRADLTSAGYTVDALRSIWGDSAEAALARGNRVPAQRAISALPPGSADAAASALARLFVLALPTPRANVAGALPALGIDGAAQLGLLDLADADTVRPLVDLRPYAFNDTQGPGHWWIASDLGEVAGGEALAEDHVLGVGGASLTLSTLMIDAPARRVLDLGTGCGIQALHAARHAGEVIGTDISERAIRFARLNAGLNDVEGIRFRVGDLFAPVAGEQFDRIVSNPPFVITPRAPGVPEYEYRDGGMVGDALVAAVIRGVAEHLAPGGVAQLLANWEYRLDESGLDRVAGWLDELAAEGHGLDAWVVERETQDPERYAETWIRDGGTRPGSARYENLSQDWLDDFAARGVTAVGFGYLLLRRPESGEPTLRRLERVETRGVNDSGLGGHIAGCLASHDWLVAAGPTGLLSARLTVAPDVTEERHYWPGAEDPTVITLRAGAGFGRVVGMDTASAAFVGACDGELSVEAICSAIAELLEVDSAALIAQLLPTVRELVEIGMLLPVSE